MRDIISPSELEAFGFGSARLLPAERVELPSAGNAEAAGARDVLVGGLMALTSLAGSARFEKLPGSMLERHGISLAVLDADKRIARVRAPGPLVVREGGVESRGFIQFEGDPGAVYWDSSEAPRLVGVAEDMLFAIARDGTTGEFITQVAMDRVLQIAPLEELRAPLVAWARALDDRWLAAHLETQAAIGGSWRSAVGAGVYARLYVAPDRAAAAARIARFTEGREDPHFTTPRRWARALDEAQRQTIEDLALAEVSALHAALEDIEDDIAADAEHWVARWRTLCHRRDDLEGVDVLLQETGRGGRLRAAMDRLDRVGRQALINVPAGALDADERIRRARLQNPSAWWADPTLEDVL
jgi:hypothetical protein